MHDKASHLKSLAEVKEKSIEMILVMEEQAAWKVTRACVGQFMFVLLKATHSGLNLALLLEGALYREALPSSDWHIMSFYNWHSGLTTKSMPRRQNWMHRNPPDSTKYLLSVRVSMSERIFYTTLIATTCVGTYSMYTYV